MRRVKPDLDSLPRALLVGSDRVVQGFFSGEPGADPTQYLRQLTHAERVLKNLRHGRSPLDGISGWVSVELPNQDMWQVQVALRMMPPDKQDLKPPPLVLFMPGAPAWNPRGRRPRSPESVEPGFLVQMLETSRFDHERRWQLVVVESPGRVRNTLRMLRNVLAALPGVVRYDPRKVFLVGDRQGAAGLASLALNDAGCCRGLVLANGGTEALTLNNIQKLGDLPVLVIPGHGHAASEGLRLHHKIAKAAGKAGHIRLLSGRKWPWSQVVGLAAKEIEAFVTRTLGQRPLRPAASRPQSRPQSRPTSRSSR